MHMFMSRDTCTSSLHRIAVWEDAALGLRLHCVLGSILAFLVSTHRSFTFFWTKTKYSVIRITIIYLTNPTEYFLGYFHLHVHIINMFVRNRIHSIQECSVLKFWFISCRFLGRPIHQPSAVTVNPLLYSRNFFHFCVIFLSRVTIPRFIRNKK